MVGWLWFLDSRAQVPDVAWRARIALFFLLIFYCFLRLSIDSWLIDS